MCPEGSFSAPEIGRLFGDAVGASLVSFYLGVSGCFVRFWVCLVCAVFHLSA